jgi:chromosome partitioning protein
MIIIAIAMQKGGVGKSTLTRSLSVASARAGLMVFALDMDPQQTTTAWSRRRGDGQLPAVRFSTELDLPLHIEMARAAGCDVIFIDTPPARSTEALAAIEAADLVLIPCTPDIESFEQLPRTVQVAKALGTKALAVLNMVTPNSAGEISIARAAFAKIGVRMADQVLHRLKIHKDASLKGRSAQEVTVISKGSGEISALWDGLAAQLNVCTGAQVHMAEGGR